GGGAAGVGELVAEEEAGGQDHLHGTQVTAKNRGARRPAPSPGRAFISNLAGWANSPAATPIGGQRRVANLSARQRRDCAPLPPYRCGRPSDPSEHRERRQKLASVTKPVRNAMPVSTSRPPMAFSTVPRWVRKRARNAANGSTAMAAIRNGMPSPSE